VDLDAGAVGHVDDAAEGIAAIGGTEDGSAEVGDFANGGAAQLDGASLGIAGGFEEAVEAVADAEDFPAQSSRRIDRALNDGVEAGGVPSAGADGDFLD